METPSAILNVLLLAFATAMSTASPAGAFVTDPLTRSDRVYHQLRPPVGTLPTLERAERRRDYQYQQQRYREQDRRMNQMPRPRPEVPIFQPCGVHRPSCR